MKKIAITLLVLCCFLINTAYAAAMLLEYDGEIHNYTGSVYELKVNGKTLTDLPLEPIIFNDRALVPVREVFEGLGATVRYTESDKSIRITYGNKTVKLQIGSATAIVDGLRKSIPDGVAPRLIAKWGESAKTMVPVRFISESVKLNVEFDGEKGIISVSEKSIRPTANPSPSPTVTPKPTTKPTASPSATEKPVTASVLNKLTYGEEDGIVTITISAKSKIDSISKAVVTSAGVLYIDVFGAEFTIKNTTEINEGPVKTVRLGQHDDYARVAVDTEGLEKYNVYLSSDKKEIIFMVTGDEDVILGMPVSTASPSPSPTASPSPSPSPTPKPIEYSEDMIVILDAGHGGSDPGAISSLMNEEEMKAFYAALETVEPILATMAPGSGEKYNEKDIALSVTKKVKKNLEVNGINVIMTREGDTYPTLDSRPNLANEEGAVLFVSLHLNSTTSAVTAANGVEVYYSEQNNDDDLGVTSKELAKALLDSVLDFTDAKSRGVKSGNLLVNRKCMMPSALVEMGFLNNPSELEKLIDDEYQDKLAAGISEGILAIHKKIKLPEKK